jgi:hypothetical protein
MGTVFRKRHLALSVAFIAVLAITSSASADSNIPVVGKWLFDGNAQDSSGNENNGTVYGSSSYVAAVHQQGLSFDGSSVYVSVPVSSSLNFGTGDFSASFWIKTSSSEQPRDIIERREYQGGPGFNVDLYYGKLLFQLADSSGYSNFYDPNSQSLADNLWHFVTITLDRDSATGLKFYVDGALVNTFNPTGRPGSVNTSSQSMYIGREIGGNYFLGILDEVALYGYCLSSNEVTQLKINGNNNGRWPLDGNGNDVSGNGNNGTLVGAPSTISGVFGQALSFNGTANVAIPDSATVNFGSGDFSIAFWLNTSSTKTGNTIIEKRSSSYVGYDVTLYSGRLLLQIGDSSGYSNYWNSSSQALNNGQWHFVAITVDRDNASGIKFYVDANLVDTFNPTDRPGSITNTDSLYFGKHRDWSYWNYVGALDEVKMYNRVLTSGEIAQQYIH